MIALQHVSKTYRVGFLYRAVPALFDISFTAEPARVLAIVGPNGAGKSTIVRIIMGLTRQTSGTVRIANHNAGTAASRRNIGYLAELPQHPPALAAHPYLALHAQLRGMTRNEAELAAHRLLDRTGLSREARTRPMEAYSKGMLQRVGLALALMGSPDILILDEPTSGLDPAGRDDVRALIDEERSRGATVIFCSHILHDVESLADNVVMLVRGSLRAQFTPADLLADGRNRAGYELHLDTWPTPPATTTPATTPTASTPSASTPEYDLVRQLHDAGASVTPRGAGAIVHLRDPAALAHVLTLLHDHRLAPTRIELARATLEAAFLEAIRNDATPPPQTAEHAP